MTEFTPEWIEEQKKSMEEYNAEGVFENPHVDYSKELDILYEYYPNALSEIQRLQAENTELRSLLLWSLNNINIPFYLFGVEDQRNVWKNKVMDILKKVEVE